MKLSLASRVTAAFLIVVVALSFGSVALVAMSLKANLEDGLSRALEQDLATWRGLLEQERRVLEVAARGAVSGPLLRAALAREEVEATVLQQLAEEQRALLGVDLLLLTDAAGAVRASSLAGPRAVAGPLRLERAGLHVIEAMPYWVVLVPVEANERNVGQLAAGILLGDELLRRMQEQSGAEALLLLGQNVNGSSLHSVGPGALLAALPALRKASGSEQVGGVRLLARQVALGEELRLVLVRSAEAELARFRATLLGLLGLGAAGALVAGGVAFLLVRRMTGPLRQLNAAVARMLAEGDFRGSLEVRSDDEIGELATSFSRLLERLREVLLVLEASAAELGAAAAQISTDAAAQNETATRQASALYQTQVTSQDLQRSSQLAAQRAWAVLQGAERADTLGRAGESAIAGSVEGLTYIRDQVDQIAHTSQELQQRTAQISGITQTVKNLADQSNMLALNAAIEAARSGEHGKGFAVVAREIRSLADQSVAATARVHEILEDISRAISDTVHTSENGAREVEGGLAQVRATGESLRALAALIHEHGRAVREIAETVSQQDAGINQLFSALKDLSALAQENVNRMSATEQAAARLSAASREVTDMVRRYKL